MYVNFDTSTSTYFEVLRLTSTYFNFDLLRLSATYFTGLRLTSTYFNLLQGVQEGSDQSSQSRQSQLKYVTLAGDSMLTLCPGVGSTVRSCVGFYRITEAQQPAVYTVAQLSFQAFKNLFPFGSPPTPNFECAKIRQIRDAAL